MRRAPLAHTQLVQARDMPVPVAVCRVPTHSRSSPWSCNSLFFFSRSFLIGGPLAAVTRAIVTLLGLNNPEEPPSTDGGSGKPPPPSLQAKADDPGAKSDDDDDNATQA